MKLQSKFMGFVVAVCAVFGIVGCGSGALSCDSREVKKVFLSRPNVKKMLKDFDGLKFVDFKTISQDKEFENIVNCQCSLKSNLGIDTINFSAERLENGKIVIDIEGWLSWDENY